MPESIIDMELFVFTRLGKKALCSTDPVEKLVGLIALGRFEEIPKEVTVALMNARNAEGDDA